MTEKVVKKRRKRKTVLKSYSVGIRGGTNRIQLQGFSKQEVIEQFQRLTGHNLQAGERSLIIATILGVVREDTV